MFAPEGVDAQVLWAHAQPAPSPIARPGRPTGDRPATPPGTRPPPPPPPAASLTCGILTSAVFTYSYAYSASGCGTVACESSNHNIRFEGSTTLNAAGTKGYDGRGSGNWTELQTSETILNLPVPCTRTSSVSRTYGAGELTVTARFSIDTPDVGGLDTGGTLKPYTVAFVGNSGGQATIRGSHALGHAHFAPQWFEEGAATRRLLKKVLSGREFEKMTGIQGLRVLRQLIEHPNPVPMSRWLTIGALDPGRWTPRFGARWRQPNKVIDPRHELRLAEIVAAFMVVQHDLFRLAGADDRECGIRGTRCRASFVLGTSATV